VSDGLVELRHEGTVLRGVLSHDTRGLVFEGEGRTIVWDRADIREARDEGGMLELRTTRGLYTLSLGDLGKLWEARAKGGSAIAEKLLVSEGASATIVGDDVLGLGGDLLVAGAKIAKSAKSAKVGAIDRVLFVVSTVTDLAKAPAARSVLAPDGILWLVAKAKPEGFREIDALLSLRKEGLRDARGIKLTESWKATRFSAAKSK
jgi:hypothetical protein